ncbi:MAG: DUF6788 family protein [Candidatus Nanopelagicales bacterium]|nr:DUF6788 family protein [Candidatus Nanopelagicales bacterium]
MISTGVLSESGQFLVEPPDSQDPCPIPATTRHPTHFRSAGKPSCRCADGRQLHESTVLSYSEGGRNRTVMLASEEIEKVRAAVERYRTASARLVNEGDTGLAALLSGRAGAQRQAR